jgi:divalent metal cation (Fe/Co/Zn/Cd) transporter
MEIDTIKLCRTGLYLEYFTVIYALLEAVASITFGSVAGSVALIGFGLDSIVESLSGFVLIWRLKHHNCNCHEDQEQIERKAQQFVALTFLILGVYIAYESVSKLLMHQIAQPSFYGIIVALASIVVMPILAWRKKIVGKAIGSKALIADSKETITCAFLSVALLVGLSANYFFGFWQADPLVGIIIVIFLFHEGYEGWNGSCDKCE